MDHVTNDWKTSFCRKNFIHGILGHESAGVRRNHAKPMLKMVYGMGIFWTALWISTMVMLGICRFGSFICNFSAHVTPWWCTKYLLQIFKKRMIGDGTAQLLGINFKPVDWIKHLQKGNAWKRMTGERMQRSEITNHSLAFLQLARNPSGQIKTEVQIKIG